MRSILFKTNLDLGRRYLPYNMVAGSLIEIPLPIEPQGSIFCLEVVSVRYTAKVQVWSAFRTSM
jgi:hypothetical protein